MNSIHIVIISLLVAYNTAHTIVPYVDPQPGENLWGLASREGTALDYNIDQDIAITATVDNTFLLLQDMSLDIDAITSTLATIITDLGIITATLNNTYQEVVNCCPCTYFISQADVPITITAAGTYCVTEDISTNVNHPIEIRGNDITLDLQGHTVKETAINSAIYVIGPTARIRIKNGTVSSPTGYGVYIFPSSSNIDIVIEKIVAYGCDRGFSLTGICQEVQYLHCIAKNCNYGFAVDATVPPSNPAILYDQCSAFNNAIHGFFISPNNTGTFACTLTNCRSEANGQIGYYVSPRFTGGILSGVSMFNCAALRNGQCGFYLRESNGVLLGCTAENNGASGLPLTDPTVGAGFYLAFNTSADVNITLISCIAINNSYSGFTDRNTLTTGPNRFFNNYAIRNRGTSQVNYDLATGVSQSVVVTTTNLLANNNLSWWTNMNGG